MWSEVKESTDKERVFTAGVIHRNEKITYFAASKHHTF